MLRSQRRLRKNISVNGMKHLIKCVILSACFASFISVSSAKAQDKPELVAEIIDQVAFPETIAPGNYSGITYIGGDEYAVVSDKSRADGFFIFHLEIDSVTGQILSASANEFRSADRPSRDQEGITFVPRDTTIFISGEGDNRIMEYKYANGERTGRELIIPDSLKISAPNYGFEALAYSPPRGMMWTMTESTLPIDGIPASPSNKVANKLRLLCFDDSLNLVAQYPYIMDEPMVKSSSASIYAMGVSELCSLNDGRLLVLEREFFVPKMKVGAFVNCKIYVIDPDDKSFESSLNKTLLLSFKTKFSGVKKDLANFEGMTLGPRLADGRQLLVLISDSQNQYKKKLKDWFMTIAIEGL